MVLGSVFKGIHEKVETAAKQKADRIKTSSYWVECPRCGKKVVKKELLKRGCYVCGSPAAESNPIQTHARTGSGPEKANSRAAKAGSNTSYRTLCPSCGKRVIRREMDNKGCYVCGYAAEPENEKE